MEKRTGSCHCGKVKYEVELDLGKPVVDCNCSYCERKGTLLSFVPQSAFLLAEGGQHLTKYHFNTGKIEHSFCSSCGVQCFGMADGPDGPTVAVNVRTIDGIDLGALTRVSFDGRSR